METYKGWTIEYEPKPGRPGLVDWQAFHPDAEEMLAGKDVDELKREIDEIEEKETKTCPSCSAEFDVGLDICDKCEKDFGDCQGECGLENCGNNHCTQPGCDSNTYSMCCPECRQMLPVELWN